MKRHTDRQTDRRNLSSFYRTSSPLGAAAQKERKRDRERQRKKDTQKEREREREIER